MKKLLVLLFTASMSLTASADILEDIKENDAEIAKPEVAATSDIWYDRGELFLTAYEENIKDFILGMPATTIKLTKGEPTKKEADDKGNEFWYYENVKLKFTNQVLQSITDLKPIYPGALDKAYEALTKSIEIYQTEEHGFFSSNNEEKSLKLMKRLVEFFITDGAKAYELEDYKKSSAFLESAFLIGSQDKYMKLHEVKAIDTSLIYNVALTAKFAKDNSKAVEYFNKAKQYGYGGANTYRSLGECYKNLKDTTAAIAAYKEGFQKYVTNEALIVDMVNIFITINKADEAIKYLDEGIKINPTNASFYYAKGVLLNTLKKTKESIATYNKAIELKDDYFEANFNIGVILYNEGVEIQKEANALPVSEMKAYDAKIKESNAKFLEAMPYFEEAHRINPKDMGTMESLKNIYFKNRKDPAIKAKLEDIKAKLGN